MRKRRGLWIWLLLLPMLAVLAGSIHLVLWERENRRANAQWEVYRGELVLGGEPLSPTDIELLRPANLLADENGAVIVERLAPQLTSLRVGRSQLVLCFHPELRHVDGFTGIPGESLEPTWTLLHEHRELLKTLQTIEEKEDSRLTGVAYDFPDDDPHRLVTPDTRPWRNAARLLRCLALLRAATGEVELAADAVATQFALAATLGNEPDTAVTLLRLDILDGALSTIETILKAGALEEPQLDRLMTLVDEHAERCSAWAMLCYERASLIHTFDALASGDLDFAAVYDQATAARLADASLNDLRTAQIQATSLWTDLVRVAEDPAALIAAAASVDTSLAADSSPGTGRALIAPLMGNTVALVKRTACGLARLRCAYAALATERYRLWLHEMPQSLPETVPDFLTTVPLDPLNGEALRLATTDTGIVVYSVGHNLVDDGGRVAPANHEATPPDTGFRLLSEAHRGSILTPTAP